MAGGLSGSTCPNISCTETASIILLKAIINGYSFQSNMRKDRCVGLHINNAGPGHEVDRFKSVLRSSRGFSTQRNCFTVL